MVLFVHGGAWRRGDKNYLGIYSGIGTSFARQGIGVVVTNYRLSPGVRHPEHIKDVARAFAWTRKNLPRYGGNAEQIFVMGHSAGGHLVALLATDAGYLKAEGLTTGAIRGVIAMSGVYEVPPKVFVDVFGADADIRKSAAPLHQVHTGVPDCLILYADKDFPGCGKEPSEAFAKALADRGNKVTTREIPDSNHYLIILTAGDPDHAVSRTIRDFIATRTSKQVAAVEKVPAPRAEVEASPQEIEQELDIPYHDGSSFQKLDVFSPKGARNRPVVFFVHGGGWMIGDKDMFGLYRGVGRFFARKGYVAVLVNYRLSPGVKHPEHVRDVAQAFAWTRRHIGEHGGAADQIFLAGHSAGGHLVSLLATDPRYLKAPELKLGDRDRAAIRGVISVSGVYRIPDGDEFVEMAGEMASSLTSMGSGLAVASAALMPLIRSGKEFNPFRLVFGDGRDVCTDASPLCHVGKGGGLPPFLLLAAENDLPRLQPMARAFHDALTKAGSPAELTCIKGHNHNTIMFRLQRPNDPTAKAVLHFLDRLGPKQP